MCWLRCLGPHPSHSGSDARDAITDRVRGLDLGADDHLLKPIDLQELGAACAPRSGVRMGNRRNSCGVQDLTLDAASRMVTLAGEPVALSPREFDLLHTLMLSAGRVLSREQIEQQPYSWGQEVDSNAVEVHIHHLRKKLGSQRIQTIRGGAIC